MKKNNMKCVVMTFGQSVKIGLKEFFSPSKTDHIFDDKEELFAYLFSIIGIICYYSWFIFFYSVVEN